MEDTPGDCDVVVIGAGAAGLLAATAAAERGKRTLLLERNPRPGVKILMSGGTRCNVTHATDARGIVAAYGNQGNFLHSALARLSPAGVVQLLAAEGVATKVEQQTGKIFPASDRAVDVLNALLKRLRRSGAVECYGDPVIDVSPCDGGLLVQTSHRRLAPEAVILATGGTSYPGCGTTGDGYEWARRLGHAIVPPRPALTPITTHEEWVRQLRGVTLPDVGVQILPRHILTESCSAKARRRAVLTEDRGSLLMAHFGLTGPVILNVSRAVSGHRNPADLCVVCDFMPDVSEAACAAWLDRLCREEGRSQLATLLARTLPRRLAECLAQRAGVAPELRAADCSRVQRQNLVAALKATAIRAAGTMGFRKAEVTAGGVSLNEVDSSTMRSKRHPALFLAGEVLDLDGPIGGYNFQAAFSTGWLAGQAV